jgi:hypothetical protein
MIPVASPSIAPPAQLVRMAEVFLASQARRGFGHRSRRTRRETRHGDERGWEVVPPSVVVCEKSKWCASEPAESHSLDAARLQPHSDVRASKNRTLVLLLLVAPRPGIEPESAD